MLPLPHLFPLPLFRWQYITPGGPVIVPRNLAQTAVYNLHPGPPHPCFSPAPSLLACVAAAALIKHRRAVLRLRGVAGHKSPQPADDNVLTNAPGPCHACLWATMCSCSTYTDVHRCYGAHAAEWTYMLCRLQTFKKWMMRDYKEEKKKTSNMKRHAHALVHTHSEPLTFTAGCVMDQWLSKGRASSVCTCTNTLLQVRAAKMQRTRSATLLIHSAVYLQRINILCNICARSQETAPPL